MDFSHGDTTSVRASSTLMFDLLERRVGAVVVDLEVLDERGMRAAGAQLLEVGLEIFDALAHPGGGVFLDVV